MAYIDPELNSEKGDEIYYGVLHHVSCYQWGFQCPVVNSIILVLQTTGKSSGCPY